MELSDKNVCIYCGTPLSKWENTRSYCWNCSELTAFEPYQEENEKDEEPTTVGTS